jgi:hypothetical protein
LIAHQRLRIEKLTRQIYGQLRGDDYGGRLTTTTMAGWGSLRPT